MFHVYAIQNQQTSKIYIGQTGKLIERIQRHNQKLPSKKSSYTYKNKGDWKLIYQEKYNTRAEAIKREKQLKSFQGRQFLKKTILGR